MQKASDDDDQREHRETESQCSLTNERLLKVLEDSGVQVQISHHVPVRTSEEAALVRGVPLASGAKAMILVNSKNTASPYLLVVMSATAKIDWKKVKKNIAKNIRMATEAEVWSISRCLPGAVPPFGSVFRDGVGIPTFMDCSLQTQTTINFNAGLRTSSVQMELSDYVRLEQPRISDLCSE